MMSEILQQVRYTSIYYVTYVYSHRLMSSVDSPLAGLGYGLPISRNYARVFGGDLIVMSMEGYGTDSFIYLPRLGERPAVV